MKHERNNLHATAAAKPNDELTIASEGVLLPLGATGFLMSMLMVAALLV